MVAPRVRIMVWLYETIPGFSWDHHTGGCFFFKLQIPNLVLASPRSFDFGGIDIAVTFNFLNYWFFYIPANPKWNILGVVELLVRGILKWSRTSLFFLEYIIFGSIAKRCGSSRMHRTSLKIVNGIAALCNRSLRFEMRKSIRFWKWVFVLFVIFEVWVL